MPRMFATCSAFAADCALAARGEVPGALWGNAKGTISTTSSKQGDHRNVLMEKSFSDEFARELRILTRQRVYRLACDSDERKVLRFGSAWWTPIRQSNL